MHSELSQDNEDEDSEEVKSYILIPKDENWNLIKWYINKIINQK